MAVYNAKVKIKTRRNNKQTQETDKLLKERFLATAEDTLEFYYQKLLTSRSPEHREALAKLISAEDQKLMLASKSSNFVAELLTTPSVVQSLQSSRRYADAGIAGDAADVSIAMSVEVATDVSRGC